MDLDADHPVPSLTLVDTQSCARADALRRIFLSQHISVSLRRMVCMPIRNLGPRNFVSANRGDQLGVFDHESTIRYILEFDGYRGSADAVCCLRVFLRR